MTASQWVPFLMNPVATMIAGAVVDESELPKTAYDEVPGFKYGDFLEAGAGGARARMYSDKPLDDYVEKDYEDMYDMVAKNHPEVFNRSAIGTLDESDAKLYVKDLSEEYKRNPNGFWKEASDILRSPLLGDGFAVQAQNEAYNLSAALYYVGTHQQELQEAIVTGNQQKENAQALDSATQALRPSADYIIKKVDDFRGDVDKDGIVGAAAKMSGETAAQVVQGFMQGLFGSELTPLQAVEVLGLAGAAVLAGGIILNKELLR
jgi:hypothetical protein